MLAYFTNPLFLPTTYSGTFFMTMQMVNLIEIKCLVSLILSVYDIL